jgi:hypothetical protein
VINYRAALSYAALVLVALVLVDTLAPIVGDIGYWLCLWLRHRRTQLPVRKDPAPELRAPNRPDIVQLLEVPPAVALCPRCGAAFERHHMVTEPLCGVCVALRWDESVKADIEDWKRKGWE